MVKKTLAHCVQPTAGERKEDEARLAEIKGERLVLERAARRLGIPFDGSAPSVWRLALALDKRLATKWTKKERQREADGVIRRGPRPAIKTAVNYKVLLAEVRGYRAAFPHLSSDREALIEMRKEHGAYRRITETALISRYKRAKEKERADKE